MKRNRISIMIAPFLLIFCSGLQASGPDNEVVILDRQDHLYRTGNIFIGGQPTLETLQWLKDEGVTLVVNLRSLEETEEFTKSSFNEEKVVRELGMHYVAIPMSGPNAYNPLTLMSFSEAVKDHEGKLLIHCGGAGRATNMYMAYMVRYEGVAVDQALKLGRQMAFYFPFGDLLGGQIEISLK